VSYVSIRHSLQTTGDGAKEVSLSVMPSGKRKSLTIFQKFIIYVLKMFTAKFTYANNSKNIVTQNLLMLDYENSIVRTNYEFPFLTVKQINDQVKNEKKRLELKKDDDYLLKFLSDSLKNFSSLNFKKNPYDLCFDIASCFSIMGFKKATVKFDKDPLGKRIFALTIRDYDHEEFHQDCPGLQIAFARSTEFYTEVINKRYQYYTSKN
jgi:hypothetical protein